MNRRRFLFGAGAVGAGILSSGNSAAQLLLAVNAREFRGNANPISEEKTVAFTLPPLPYAFDALEPYIDAQTMQIHHDKHHAAYVNNLNKALEPYPNLQSKSLEDLLKGLDALSALLSATMPAAIGTTPTSGQS
jgi:hypothetical protein